MINRVRAGLGVLVCLCGAFVVYQTITVHSYNTANNTGYNSLFTGLGVALCFLIAGVMIIVTTIKDNLIQSIIETVMFFLVTAIGLISVSLADPGFKDLFVWAIASALMGLIAALSTRKRFKYLSDIRKQQKKLAQMERSSMKK